MRPIAALVLVIVLMVSAAAASAQEQSGQPQSNLPPVVAPELFDRAVSALDEDNFDRAILDLSTFILLNPTNPQAYYLRADSYISRGHLDMALDDLSHAIKFSDSLPELQLASYVQRAGLYADEGRNQEALADLGEAVAIEPSAELYQNRALLYFEEADFEAAVSDFDEAINLGATNPALYFYRATAQTELEHPMEAAADYYQWITGIQETLNEQEVLAAGESVTVELQPSVVHSIPFRAEAGQVVNVVAANLSGDADPLVVLVGPGGDPLAGNDGTRSGDTSAVISNFPLPEAGFYNLLVTHSISGYNGRVVVLLEMDEE